MALNSGCESGWGVALGWFLSKICLRSQIVRILLCGAPTAGVLSGGAWAGPWPQSPGSSVLLHEVYPGLSPSV